MRTFVAATMAATIIASSAFAAADVGTLPAGKPAGVKKAQGTEDNTVWWLVGLGVAAGGIALIASGDSDATTVGGTVTGTTVTTTTSSK